MPTWLITAPLTHLACPTCDMREQGTLARRELSLGSWEPVSVWIWHEALLGMPLARSLP